MVKAGLQRLSGLAPPPLRRAAAGLWLDLKSLPVRWADPARREDPWAVTHNVGAGDFREAGETILRELVEIGGLKPADRVLDIGCGVGRVALPLANYLTDGGYTGFDVSRRAVEICRRRFAGQRNFRFIHADVRNAEYRRSGGTPETAYDFPMESGSVDFAFATSVFSHMRLASIGHYLAEIRRSLAPGGRCLFTAYLLTAERRRLVKEGESAIAFHDWHEGSMVLDPRSPERAIAHEAEAILAAVAAVGLRPICPWMAGSWCGDPAYPGFQDLVVVARP